MNSNNIDYGVKANTVSTNPFIYKTPSISSKSIRILIMLVLQIIMLGVTRSFSAMYVILATTIGSVLAFTISFLFSGLAIIFLNKKKLKHTL